MNGIRIKLECRNIMTLPLNIGNTTNFAYAAKLSGHSVSKADIDDHDKGNIIYQNKATLLNELIFVDTPRIQSYFRNIHRLRLSSLKNFLENLKSTLDFIVE